MTAAVRLRDVPGRFFDAQVWDEIVRLAGTKHPDCSGFPSEEAGVARLHLCACIDGAEAQRIGGGFADCKLGFGIAAILASSRAYDGPGPGAPPPGHAHIP